MVGYAARVRNLTINPGDRIVKEPQSLEEKAKQLAVDAPDITGDYIKVPTYFIVKYPNDETKALHHVRDAKEISNVIRQMRFEEESWPQEAESNHHTNLTGIILTIALFLMTATILIGIF
jgi:hypothetical protein